MVLTEAWMKPWKVKELTLPTLCSQDFFSGLKDYWTLLHRSWDHELYYSKEPQKGKTYARHGGLVDSETCTNKTGNTDPTWAMDGKRSWWIEEISNKYLGTFCFPLDRCCKLMIIGVSWFQWFTAV